MAAYPGKSTPGNRGHYARRYPGITSATLEHHATRFGLGLAREQHHCNWTGDAFGRQAERLERQALGEELEHPP